MDETSHKENVMIVYFEKVATKLHKKKSLLFKKALCTRYFIRFLYEIPSALEVYKRSFKETPPGAQSVGCAP